MPRPRAVETHARSYKTLQKDLVDATALCSGNSRFVLQYKRWLLDSLSVRLHGTRPWHPAKTCDISCSRERESPRRKAVASSTTLHNNPRACFITFSTLNPNSRSAMSPGAEAPNRFRQITSPVDPT